MPQTPSVCVDEHRHTVHPLCFWLMLHFSAHTFKIICHLAFLSPFLSLVFCWFFNRKQRQQSLGRRWKTTALLCTPLSTNVLYFSSLPLKRLDLRLCAVLLMSAYYYYPPLGTERIWIHQFVFTLLSSGKKWPLLSFQYNWIWAKALDTQLRKSVLPWKAMWRPIGQPLAFPSREGRSLSVAGNHWLEQGNSFGFSGPDRLAQKDLRAAVSIQVSRTICSLGEKDCGQQGPGLWKYHAVCKSLAVNGCWGCHTLF